MAAPVYDKNPVINAAMVALQVQMRIAFQPGHEGLLVFPKHIEVGNGKPRQRFYVGWAPGYDIAIAGRVG